MSKKRLNNELIEEVKDLTNMLNCYRKITNDLLKRLNYALHELGVEELKDLDQESADSVIALERAIYKMSELL